MVWSTSVTSRPARQSPTRMAESPCANWTEQTGRLAVVAPRWSAERPSTLSIQSAMSKRGMPNRMDGRRTSHHSNRGPATFEGQTGPLDRLDCEVSERHRVPDSSPGRGANKIEGVTSQGVAPSSFYTEHGFTAFPAFWLPVIDDSDPGACAWHPRLPARGQCPQAILQTPLLHKSQRVRGLKLRIEGEHAAQAPAHHSLFDWTNSAPTWSHTERSGLVTSNAVWP